MALLETALGALERRLDPYSRSPVAVAFSGGSDSTALLLCAREWMRRTNRPLLALTVDHGLHPDSAAWTAAAGRLASEAGARWRPLCWSGAKPFTGLPAAARAARHALLAEATREVGATALLVGHTADDVAESELIRRETPGHGRLQEWSPSPVWPQGRGVFLLRPLLALRRGDLRGWLQGWRVGWMDDPANVDPRFARTRARLALANPLACASTSAETSAVTPMAAPPVKITEAWSGLQIDRRALLAAPDPAAILGRAILCAAGVQRPVRRAALARMLERLAESAAAAVLGGARITAGQDRVCLSRELGRSPPPPLHVAGDHPHVFDGRFELYGLAPGWTIRPLAGAASCLPKIDRETLSDLSPGVRASLPVLCTPKGEARLPAPLGLGPEWMRSLVKPRLLAALGQVQDEAAAVRLVAESEAHGGRRKAVLSCPAETEVLRQAAAARRMAAYPTS